MASEVWRRGLGVISRFSGHLRTSKHGAFNLDLNALGGQN